MLFFHVNQFFHKNFLTKLFGKSSTIYNVKYKEMAIYLAATCIILVYFREKKCNKLIDISNM